MKYNFKQSSSLCLGGSLHSLSSLWFVAVRRPSYFSCVLVLGTDKCPLTAADVLKWIKWIHTILVVGRRWIPYILRNFLFLLRVVVEVVSLLRTVHNFVTFGYVLCLFVCIVFVCALLCQMPTILHVDMLTVSVTPPRRLCSRLSLSVCLSVGGSTWKVRDEFFSWIFIAIEFVLRTRNSWED